MNTHVPASRAILVWLAATGASVLGVALGLDTARDVGRSSGGGTPFVDLVVGLAGLALVGCAVWVWLVSSAVLLQARRGDTGEVAGVPRWAHRAVLAACGLAAISTAPAQAGTFDPTPGDAPACLSGLPYPDRAIGRAHPHSPVRSRPGRPEHHPIVVEPHDSLWSLSRDHLRRGASEAEIVAAVEDLYAMNRDLIGADPDLISPRQILRTPHSLRSDRTEETA